MKKIILIGITVISCFGFFACEQAISTPELEQFMNVSWVGAKNNPDIKKIDLLSTSDTTFYIAMNYGGTTNFERGDITASFEVDRSLVESFNEANFTEYLPLPEGSYSFSTTSVQIPNGKNASDPVGLTIRKNAVNLSYEYILPVTVKSVTGNLLLNEELKTLYLVFRADVDEDNGRERWTTVEASSEQSANPASRAFDGNRDSYWQSDAAGSMPQWFAVNMQGFKRVSGFTWLNRADLTANAVPKHVKFETSMNGIDWTEALDVPEVSESRLLQVFPLEENVLAKFFRVTVLSNWADLPYTYVAEVDIYSGDAPVVESDNIQKYKWTIVEDPGFWQAGYEASKAIDDLFNTCWHTTTSGEHAKWYFVIDFHKSLKVSGILFRHRLSTDAITGDYPKHIRFQISDDMTTWTTIYENEDLPQQRDVDIDLPCTPVMNGRYMKVQVIPPTFSGGGGWTYIGEINIY